MRFLFFQTTMNVSFVPITAIKRPIVRTQMALLVAIVMLGIAEMALFVQVLMSTSREETFAFWCF